VARQAYDAAIMAPLFVAMSLSFGLAVFVLIAAAALRWSGRLADPALLERLRRLLGLFVVAVLYFVAAQHLTNLYATEHHGIERFILVDGGVYTWVFWAGQIGIGSALPLVLVFHPRFAGASGWLLGAAGLVVAGGIAQIYVLIIGAQAYPLLLFPGMEIVQSSFFDGQIAAYRPSLPELALGLGGVSIALLIVTLGLKVLRFLPADAVPSPPTGTHTPD